MTLFLLCSNKVADLSRQVCSRLSYESDPLMCGAITMALPLARAMVNTWRHSKSPHCPSCPVSWLPRRNLSVKSVAVSLQGRGTAAVVIIDNYADLLTSCQQFVLSNGAAAATQVPATVQCTVCTVHCAIYSVHCTVYIDSKQWTVKMNSKQCTVYSAQFKRTVNSTHCTVYSIYWTLCNIQYTECSIK